MSRRHQELSLDRAHTQNTTHFTEPRTLELNRYHNQRLYRAFPLSFDINTLHGAVGELYFIGIKSRSLCCLLIVEAEDLLACGWLQRA
jgi:hypothetical protein